MDNLCHTLVGAALGRAGLRDRTRFGSATLMVAANIPDVDVLVFATSTPAVAFRRGWTHGPIGQILLPLALTAIVLLIARRFGGKRDGPPVDARWLFILSLAGVLSHVALDLLNPYGLRILAPFSWQWFYGDALFIIDPWMWLMLGLGVWLSRRRGTVGPARHALLVLVLYVAAMTFNARIARGVVLQDWERSFGGPPAALMVGPVPLTPFRKQIIADDSLEYSTGTLNLLPRDLAWDPRRVPKNDQDPRAARAREDPRIRGFLVWSRFPFWTFEPVEGGTRVTVSDMRIPARGGTFSESVVVPD